MFISYHSKKHLNLNNSITYSLGKLYKIDKYYKVSSMININDLFLLIELYWLKILTLN